MPLQNIFNSSKTLQRQTEYAQKTNRLIEQNMMTDDNRKMKCRKKLEHDSK